MLDRLISEIPSFMYFLIARGIQYEKQSRMWFLPQDIFTDALQRLKDDNASLVEKEIKETADSIVEPVWDSATPDMPDGFCLP